MMRRQLMTAIPLAPGFLTGRNSKGLLPQQVALEYNSDSINATLRNSGKYKCILLWRPDMV